MRTYLTVIITANYVFKINFLLTNTFYDNLATKLEKQVWHSHTRTGGVPIIT